MAFLTLVFNLLKTPSGNDRLFTLAIPRCCLTKNLVMRGNDLFERSGHSYLSMCGF